VNDNHRHSMGDDALKLVAEILQSCSRRPQHPRGRR
jgi:PleD family two-component response regulator